MDPNKLTIYDLTQPTEMHKDYGWWHIQRNGDGLADVQNQHEALKIVEELQRQADEVHALRAEVERLQAEIFDLRALADKRTRDERDRWCEREGECWLMDGPCAGHDRHREGPLLKQIAADDARIAEQEWE